jgi:hypothetical protein
LTISTPIAAITFDSKALDTIAGVATTAVKISAAKADAAALDQETKQVVGDRPVFDFTAYNIDPVPNVYLFKKSSYIIKRFLLNVVEEKFCFFIICNISCKGWRTVINVPV